MTKIPTEVIKLAIEGGFDWFGYGSEVAPNDEWYSSRVALDREFWCGLSKSLGWPELVHKPCGHKMEPKGRGTRLVCWLCYGQEGANFDDTISAWEYHAHHFYQCALSGQDPTEWWAGLIANK